MEKKKSKYKAKYADIYSAPIGSEKFHKKLEKVTSTELVHVCNSFKVNMDNLSSATLLPISIAYNTSHQIDQIERFRKALIQGDLEGTREEQKIEIEKRMDSFTKNDSIEWSLSVLDDLMDEEDIKNGITNLFNFSIVNIWAIFEVISQDMWIAIVNSRPKTLGRAAFQAKKENVIGSIANMMLESCFELSLKNQIGDIASSEYDFTGVKGIEKAFLTVLKKDQIEITSLLSNEFLIELQALRNAIIHNSGIIDEAYCRMTNDDSKLGKKTETTGKQLTIYANSIFSLCTDFIILVDRLIKTNYLD